MEIGSYKTTYLYKNETISCMKRIIREENNFQEEIVIENKIIQI